MVGPAAPVPGRRRGHPQAARHRDPGAGRVDGRARAASPGADLDPLGRGRAEATRRSISPAMYPQMLELVREHRSTIVFVNNRRGAERLALRLNELARDEDIARAHHGSLAREERTVVEEMSEWFCCCSSTTYCARKQATSRSRVGARSRARILGEPALSRYKPHNVAFGSRPPITESDDLAVLASPQSNRAVSRGAWTGRLRL